MPSFDLFRHVWIMFVVVTVLNAFFLKFRAAQHVRERPELENGYDRLFTGYMLWGNLPWLVMGAGLEFGGVPNIFSYLRPADGNPFVLAWFAVLLGEYFLGFQWLFAGNGAEFLAEHPNLFSYEVRDPRMIKLLYCFVTAGFIAFLMFLVVASPVPQFGE